MSEGALNAVDPVRQGRQGIEDSVAKFYDQTRRADTNKGTPALVHYLTENSMNSVDWLEDLGVKFKDEIGTATGALGSAATIRPLLRATPTFAHLSR